MGKNTSTNHLTKITYHLNESVGQLDNNEINELIYLNQICGNQLLKNWLIQTLKNTFQQLLISTILTR